MGRAYPLASFQFSPMPSSTVSGTVSSAAPSMRARTSAATSPAGRLAAHLEQQLVVDRQDHARARSSPGEPAERGVDVDHGPLEDVRGGALDGQVDRHPLGRGPDLPVATRKFWHEAPPAVERADN